MIGERVPGIHNRDMKETPTTQERELEGTL